MLIQTCIHNHPDLLSDLEHRLVGIATERECEDFVAANLFNDFVHMDISQYDLYMTKCWLLLY